ncbi:MAG: sterol desaturase family protein [Deltaproteobacteria bacterium]|nr:sterol desaturase family protein [Deltaproteobacteria bacterium]
MITVAFTAGALGWSFTEYALHRWVGHDPRSKRAFAVEHRTHHAQRGYFTPTGTKALAAAPLLGAGALGAGALLGAPGVSFFAGFAAAYVGYEVLHRRLHTHGPRGPLGRFLRRHHFTHHFVGPQHNHGVTSPLWDKVFGTLRDPGVLRVPEKHAMDWLLDPATGEVREAYARDYVLHRRGAPRARERAAA